MLRPVWSSRCDCLVAHHGRCLSVTSPGDPNAQVKEQKRRDAEETVKKLNDSKRLAATGGKVNDDDDDDDDYASDGFESAGEGGSGEEKSGEDAKSPAGGKTPEAGDESKAGGDDGGDDDDDRLDDDAVKAMIKRLGLSEAEMDDFMAFRAKHAATTGSAYVGCHRAHRAKVASACRVSDACVVMPRCAQQRHAGAAVRGVPRVQGSVGHGRPQDTYGRHERAHRKAGGTLHAPPT